MTHKKPLVFMLVTLAVITLAVIYYSSLYVGASAWLTKANNSLTAWQKAGKINNQQDYNDGLDAINKSLLNIENSPSALATKANIIFWGISAGFVPSTEFSTVITLYKQSLSLRPSWGEIWLDLAKASHFQLGFTDEVKYYIAQGLRYGPYNQYVNMSVAELYLANFKALTPTEVGIFYQQTAIILKQGRAANTLFKAAENAGLSPLLCTQLSFNAELQSQKDSWIFRKYCSS